MSLGKIIGLGIASLGLAGTLLYGSEMYETNKRFREIDLKTQEQYKIIGQYSFTTREQLDKSEEYKKAFWKAQKIGIPYVSSIVIMTEGMLIYFLEKRKKKLQSSNAP